MRTKTALKFPWHEVRQYCRLSGGQPTGIVVVNANLDKHGVTWVSMDMQWTSPQLKRYNVMKVQMYLRIAGGDRTALEVMLTRGSRPPWLLRGDQLVSQHKEAMLNKVLRIRPDVPQEYAQAVGDDMDWLRVNHDLLCNIVYALHEELGQSSPLAGIIVADLEQIMHKHAGLWRSACRYAMAMTALTDA